jgi:pimeloyl-ACP methyl ester carboxylesterase
VDPDRVYVVGFSMGGTGSWHFAGRFPDLFAGAAPCNGVVMANPVSQVPSKDDVLSIQYGLVPNVRNLPMYFCTGTADRNCMPGTFLYVWDVIQDLKKRDPGGYEQIRFECHEGLAHSFGPGQPAKALEWLAGLRRDTYPKKIVWEYASDPHPLPDSKDRTRRYARHWFYWIQHENPSNKMELTATREGNEFSVEVSGGDREGFWLLLNPAMIDVTKDVVVKVDGQEFYRGRPEPRFATVVETLDGRLDKSLCFDRKVPLWKR